MTDAWIWLIENPRSVGFGLSLVYVASVGLFLFQANGLVRERLLDPERASNYMWMVFMLGPLGLLIWRWIHRDALQEVESWWAFDPTDSVDEDDGPVDVARPVRRSRTHGPASRHRAWRRLPPRV